MAKIKFDNFPRTISSSKVTKEIHGVHDGGTEIILTRLGGDARNITETARSQIVLAHLARSIRSSEITK